MSTPAQSETTSLLEAMLELGQASSDSPGGTPTAQPASTADLQSLIDEPLVTASEPPAKRPALHNIACFAPASLNSLRC